MFSALSLKVLAVIASVVIVGGSTTSILVTQLKKSETPQQRQDEIDKIENLNKFLSNVGGADISEGETFSDKAFTDAWKPSIEENKYISTNWKKIIPKMPIKFFEKAENLYWPYKVGGVCHIKYPRTKINSMTKQFYMRRFQIPVLCSELTEFQSFVKVLGYSSGQIDIARGLVFLDADTAHKTSKNKERLQKIIDGTEKRKVRVGTFGYEKRTPAQKEKAIAKDLLVLQALVDATIDRLEALGIANYINPWTFACTLKIC